MAQKKEPLSEHEKQMNKFGRWVKSQYNKRKMLWLDNYIEYLTNNPAVSPPEGITELDRVDMLSRATEVRDIIKTELEMARTIK